MIARVPISRTQRSQLFGSFVAGDSDLIESLLGRYDSVGRRWEKAVTRQTVRGEGETGTQLTSSLLECNRSLGASSSVLEKIEGAGAGTARYVVTGQQPGVLR